MTVTQSPIWKTGVISAAFVELPVSKQQPEPVAQQPSSQPGHEAPYMTPVSRDVASLVAKRNTRNKRLSRRQIDSSEHAVKACQKLRNQTASTKCKSQIGDRLIDFATDLIVSTWPSDTVSRKMVRHFISEAVRRSCTSYALLQLAVYYCSLAREWANNRRKDDPNALVNCATLGCGRRVFLAALVVAHKYHIDRSFGATAWSKISCLPSKQIVAMELDLLKALDWKVHVPYLKFAEWCQSTLDLSSLLVAKESSGTEFAHVAAVPSVQMLTPDNSPVS